MQIRTVNTAFWFYDDNTGQKTFFPLGPQSFTDEQAAHWLVRERTTAAGDTVVNEGADDGPELINRLQGRIVELTQSYQSLAADAERDRGELSAARAGNVSLVKDRDATIAEHVKTRQELTAVIGQLEVAKVEAEEYRRQLVAMTEERDTLAAQLDAAKGDLAAHDKVDEDAKAAVDAEKAKAEAAAKETGTEGTQDGTGTGSEGSDATKTDTKPKGRPKATSDE